MSESFEEIRWQETLEALRCTEEGETIDEEQVLTWLKSWGTDHELPPPQVDGLKL